jgi:DNA-directed RNA polymerase subunit RPC12/RpoP
MTIPGQDDFFDPLKHVIPPGPGQTGHYVCHACGERFTRTIPLFFDFIRICPKCGSFRVGKDWMVVY